MKNYHIYFQIIAKDIPRCKVNDEACLIKAVSDTIKIVGSKGRSDLNVQALDPMHINKMKVTQGANSPVAVNMTLTDLDVYGIPDVQIHKIGQVAYLKNNRKII